MFTQLKHFRRENEFTQKRWVYLEDAETPAMSQENLAEKTPAELMEMLRQEGAVLEEKKEIVRSLIGKLEQSNVPEILKKSIRDEVSEVLTTMETSENALEIHRLRFELAGTIQAEGMSDIAEWWEKIKIVSPTKNAIMASFESLKNMDWSEMLNGGLDKLMEYGGMIVSFISGGKIGKSAADTPEDTVENQQQPEDSSERTQQQPEQLSEQVTSVSDLMDIKVVNGLIAFKTNVNGALTEWQVNTDGSPLFRKQEDGEINTSEGNFKEIKDEQPLPFFTEYLATHYSDLLKIANNVKDENESAYLLSARLLAEFIRLQQTENQRMGEKIDVINTLQQFFNPEEQKELIRNQGSDPDHVLNTLHERKLQGNQ